MKMWERSERERNCQILESIREREIETNLLWMDMNFRCDYLSPIGE